MWGLIFLAAVATIGAGVATLFIVFANGMRASPGAFVGRGLIILAWIVPALLWFACLITAASAHDHARPGLDNWYQSQKSGRGPCCDGPGVDAKTLADVDWEVKNKRYRVRIDGEWIDVPDEAVLPGPNLDGRTIVWPMTYQDGSVHVRCFIAGAMG